MIKIKGLAVTLPKSATTTWPQVHFLIDYYCLVARKSALDTARKSPDVLNEGDNSGTNARSPPPGTPSLSTITLIYEVS